MTVKYNIGLVGRKAGSLSGYAYSPGMKASGLVWNQATLTAYRGGSGSLDAVLDARRLEIDTRIDRLRLDMETAGLWAQLHYLTPADPAERRAAAIPTTTDQ